MFVMACLFGFTLNIVEAFETTYTMMTAFYVGLFARFTYSLPSVIRYQGLLFAMGTLLRRSRITLTRVIDYAKAFSSCVYFVDSVFGSYGTGFHDSADDDCSCEQCDLDREHTRQLSYKACSGTCFSSNHFLRLCEATQHLPPAASNLCGLSTFVCCARIANEHYWHRYGLRYY